MHHTTSTWPRPALLFATPPRGTLSQACRTGCKAPRKIHLLAMITLRQVWAHCLHTPKATTINDSPRNRVSPWGTLASTPNRLQSTQHQENSSPHNNVDDHFLTGLAHVHAPPRRRPRSTTALATVSHLGGARLQASQTSTKQSTRKILSPAHALTPQGAPARTRSNTHTMPPLNPHTRVVASLVLVAVAQRIVVRDTRVASNTNRSCYLYEV